MLHSRSECVGDSSFASWLSAWAADSCEVRLSDAGQLGGAAQREGKNVRHDTEPGAGFWQRAGISFLSMLPIEWLL
jgi:putative cardiolipin synthase